MITKEASKWLRGIAILMVVASHYAEWIGAGNLEPLREFISRLGDYGVDIFFLMSGYGLAKAVGSKKISLEFVWKRAISAYFPYLLIIGGLEIYDGYFLTKILAKENYLWKFLVGYDYWFMMNLFVFYQHTCHYQGMLQQYHMYQQVNQEVFLMILHHQSHLHSNQYHQYQPIRRHLHLPAREL